MVARALVGLQRSAEMICVYVDAKILPATLPVERGRLWGLRLLRYEGTRARSETSSSRMGRLPTARVQPRLLLHVIETLQQSPGFHGWKRNCWCSDAGWVARHSLSKAFSATRTLMVLNP